jgi:hypothetical protein
MHLEISGHASRISNLGRHTDMDLLAHEAIVTEVTAKRCKYTNL